MQLPEGILEIESILGERYLHQYVLRDESCLLVDAGCADTSDEVIVPLLDASGVKREDMRHVLITHADVDHYGGSARIRRAYPRALFMAHGCDAPLIESKALILRERYGWYAAHGLAYPDETVRWLGEAAGEDVHLDLVLVGGEVLRLGPDRPVRIVNLPGHSEGHVGVYDARHRAMIVSDAVMGRGLCDVQGRLISPPPYFSVRAYVDSIAAVRAHRPELLLTGHYPAMAGDAVERFLTESLDFVTSLEQGVIDTLRHGGAPRTLKQITHALAERMGPFTVMANELAGPVRAHLRDLMTRELVLGIGAGGEETFTFA